MAKVKPSIRPTETYTEPNFLRLHTFTGDREQATRLVTIEHLSYQAQPTAATGRFAKSGWQCQTIVDGEAMTKEDALFIAKTYAAENNIPVIYECHSE
jgi:hypothetical protein